MFLPNVPDAVEVVIMTVSLVIATVWLAALSFPSKGERSSALEEEGRVGSSTYTHVRKLRPEDNLALIELSRRIFGPANKEWLTKMQPKYRPLVLGVFRGETLVSFVMGFDTTLTKDEKIMLETMRITPANADNAADNGNTLRNRKNMGKAAKSSEQLEGKDDENGGENDGENSEEAKRNAEKESKRPCFQLWMGGTHPQHRKRGFMKLLVRAVTTVVQHRARYSTIKLVTQKNEEHPVCRMCLKEGMRVLQKEGSLTTFVKDVSADAKALEKEASIPRSNTDDALYKLQ